MLISAVQLSDMWNLNYDTNGPETDLNTNRNRLGLQLCLSPSSEYSGLISFKIDWFGLLAVQGTLKSSLAQSKASVLQLSAFFMVQLSHCT